MSAEANPPRNWGGESWEGLVRWPDRPESRFYDLAVRLEPGMTHHAAHPPFTYELSTRHGDHEYPGGISAAMEHLSMGAHVGTHVDALGHISVRGCIFDGQDIMTRQHEDVGLDIGTVEELPPLVGPGHLVDGELIFGRELTHRDGFGEEELEAWFEDRPAPAAGSVVLFRTGWMKFWNDSDRYLGREAGIPGVTLSGARWLSERGVLAVGSDTVNFEHKPHLTVPSLDVHVHLLVEAGIPIMESVNLEQLAADHVYEFFFMAAPLRIGGGTGSPLRPLAVVSA